MDLVYVSLDVETTGTWLGMDRVTDVAFIRLNADGSFSEFTSLVNPEIEIPSEVEELTGITNSMVKDAPLFREVLPSIESFLSSAGTTLVGFNSTKFDIPMLDSECERCGSDFRFAKMPSIDSYHVFSKHSKRDLPAALQFYLGRDMESHHRALPDARVTMEVFREQLSRGLPEDGPRPPGYIDARGQLRLFKGEPYFAFGKHNTLSVRAVKLKDPGYIRWILGSDFSAEVKDFLAGFK